MEEMKREVAAMEQEEDKKEEEVIDLTREDDPSELQELYETDYCAAYMEQEIANYHVTPEMMEWWDNLSVEKQHSNLSMLERYARDDHVMNSIYNVMKKKVKE